jgi:hypothetical protein
MARKADLVTSVRSPFQVPGGNHPQFQSQPGQADRHSMIMNQVLTGIANVFTMPKVQFGYCFLITQSVRDICNAS